MSTAPFGSRRLECIGFWTQQLRNRGNPGSCRPAELQKMRSQKRFAGLAGGFVLAACAPMILAGCHIQPALTPQQAEGKHLYDVRCAHCHEDNDLGLKKVPPNLHEVFSQATMPRGVPATNAEIERVVLSGKGMMPTFAGRFTKDQLDALVAYMHTGMRDAKTE
jgi:mono/diheme cytochrome c family protein